MEGKKKRTLLRVVIVLLTLLAIPFLLMLAVGACMQLVGESIVEMLPQAIGEFEQEARYGYGLELGGGGGRDGEIMAMQPSMRPQRQLPEWFIKEATLPEWMYDVDELPDWFYDLTEAPTWFHSMPRMPQWFYSITDVPDWFYVAGDVPDGVGTDSLELSWEQIAAYIAGQDALGGEGQPSEQNGGHEAEQGEGQSADQGVEPSGELDDERSMEHGRELGEANDGEEPAGQSVESSGERDDEPRMAQDWEHRGERDGEEPTEAGPSHAGAAVSDLALPDGWELPGDIQAPEGWDFDEWLRANGWQDGSELHTGVEPPPLTMSEHGNMANPAGLTENDAQPEIAGNTVGIDAAAGNDEVYTVDATTSDAVIWLIIIAILLLAALAIYLIRSKQTERVR